jgi:DNA-directed RNA polymerase specialized sigma subunit
MPKSYLEPNYSESFQQWQAKPTPMATDQLLQQVEPVIQKSLVATAGPSYSPLLRSHARRIALQAFQSYDPSQAKLGTHLTNHLQGLRRVYRQQSQVMATPERVSMDAAYVNEQSQRLEDELGRPPSAQELANTTGLSPRRLAHLSKFRQPMAEGTFSDTAMGEDQSNSPGVMADSPYHLAQEVIYQDLEPKNQLIMEHTLGLHGRPVLSNQQLAARLRLSPGAISQRKLSIQQKLDEAMDMGIL